MKEKVLNKKYNNMKFELEMWLNNNQQSINMIKKSIIFLSFVLGGVMVFTIFILALMYGKGENWKEDFSSMIEYIIWSSLFLFSSVFFVLKKF